MHAMEVGGYGDGRYLLERSKVDDGEGAVVVGGEVAAGVGDLESITNHHQAVRLKADMAGIDDPEGGGSELGYIADLCVAYLHGSRVGGAVAVAIGKSEVTAVGDIDLRDMLCRGRVHHLNEVGAVDDSVEFAAVDTQVVAHIAEPLRDVGGGVVEDSARIGGGGVVVVVEGGFVGAHVALVEEVEALHLGVYRSALRLLLRREDNLRSATGKEEEEEEETGLIPALPIYGRSMKNMF